MEEMYIKKEDVVERQLLEKRKLRNLRITRSGKEKYPEDMVR